MVRTCWTRRHSYELAHIEVYSGKAFLWAEAVSGILRRVGKPYVLTLHGGNLPAFVRKWPRRTRRTIAAAAAVTAPSRYLLEQMRSCRPDIRLLPNAIDRALYQFSPRETLRPKLVWLRAFHEVYDPWTAVRVLALLKDRFPDITLLMIGPEKSGGVVTSLHRMAEQFGVAQRLVIRGPVPKAEVGCWLSGRDVFLNTSTVDNTPVSVLEAMASGLCVVSTNVGGLPYILEHERDSLVIPARDPVAMAGAVARFLTEPDLAKRCSINGRRKAEQLDWSLCLPQWEELFLEVLKEHRR
jgi:glycosyltransferase involved in cell wall biosynthesis